MKEVVPQGQRGEFARILVIRFRLMGDLLLVTPVLRVLRQRFPDSHIAVLADAPANEMVEGHPALNEVIVFKRPEDVKLSLWARAARYWRVLREIRRQRFDLVINLHPHGVRGGFVTLWSGAATRVGYDRPGSRTFWYNVKAPYQFRGTYRVEHHLDALRALGIEAKVELPSIATSEKDRAFATELLAGGQRPVVIIFPGRPDSRRAWPTDRYANVADALIGQYGARVLFIGIPAEGARVETIRRTMRNKAESLVGRATVKQLAAVMAGADLFIGMDSSPLHLASAVGLPTVSLFSYYWPKDWKPIGEEHIAVHKPLADHPCSPPTCCQPGDAPCMRNISVEEVLSAAGQLLRSPRKRPSSA
jgi:predicted lipopolysaccharide heptosyltransferase III